MQLLIHKQLPSKYNKFLLKHQNTNHTHRKQEETQHNTQINVICAGYVSTSQTGLSYS